MVLRQKIVKVVCEWPEFGGTAAGSQWINQPGMDGFVVSCVLALFVLARMVLTFSYPNFLHKIGCILIVS